MLAAQADGASITTVEGLAGDEELTPLQRSFAEHHALQCGYCTPGMLMSATALLEQNPSPSEDEVKVALQGNICRCTGLLEHRRGGRRGGKGGRHDRRRDRGHDHPPEGLRRAERPAEGGSAARRGAGRLLRRREAPRDGLPPLRPLAVPARADPVDRRLRGARAARRLRDADRRRGRDPHRPVLPDRRGAGRQRQGLRARRRQGAIRRRARRRGRRGDARARPRRRRARDGRLRAARRRRRRTQGARRRTRPCSTRSAAAT